MKKKIQKLNVKAKKGLAKAKVGIEKTKVFVQTNDVQSVREKVRTFVNTNDADTIREKIKSLFEIKIVSVDVIRIVSARYKFEYDFDTNFLIYVPFIGWLYPFTWKKNDEYAMFHARQAFLAALLFAAVPTALTLSTIFIPTTMRVFRLLVVLLIYASHLTYFGLCVWGTMFLRKKEKGEFPYIKDYIARIGI